MKLKSENSNAPAHLPYGFTVDPVNSDAGDVLARGDEIDVVNSPLIAPHVDAGGSAIGPVLFLPPNVKRRQREIFSVRIEMELSVF